MWDYFLIHFACVHPDLLWKRLLYRQQDGQLVVSGLKPEETGIYIALVPKSTYGTFSDTSSGFNAESALDPSASMVFHGALQALWQPM